MSIATPNTQEISDSIVAQVEVAIDQSIPLLPKSFTRVLAKVLAGALLLLYKYVGFVALQRFATTATYDETEFNGRTVRPLLELGRSRGVTDPRQARPAEHVASVTVTTQAGSIPAGTLLLHAPTGVVHSVIASVALNAPTVNVRIVAVSDANGGTGEGEIGNLLSGDIVSFASPLANVSRNAAITSRTVDGEDAETVDSYRQRVINRGRQRPQGGSYADFKEWAELAPGISSAYPYTGAPGEVDVYVEATEASSGSSDGVPTSGQLAQVLSSIMYDDDGRLTRAPAGTAVNVIAITRRAFDVAVVGLVASDVPAAEQAITDAVDEYLRTRRPFIVGLSLLPREDRVSASSIIGIVEEAAAAVGATINGASVLVGGVLSPVYALGKGELAKLGNITF